MEFDDAKENIQPLAAGRDASILYACLKEESQQDLQNQRRELEEEIHNYEGDDPLEPWCKYIGWIEQRFPSGGKESGLDEVVVKCLSRFAKERRYFQDRRVIKLYIKHIDCLKNPAHFYQQLYNGGIGTMVADFYISWAYCYDLSGNTKKAIEIFRHGIRCRAEPLDELKEAFSHFEFIVAQRVLYKNNDEARQHANSQLDERRLALTSLRTYGKAALVSSIRTGTAVKSFEPGTLKAGAKVKQDENKALPQIFVENSKFEEAEMNGDDLPSGSGNTESVVNSILSSALKKENEKEPGPWNKKHQTNKSEKLFPKVAINTNIGFSIHEDNSRASLEDNKDCPKALNPPIVSNTSRYNKSFKYPPNFQAQNRSQAEWNVCITTETETTARCFPQYNKCLVYPQANKEFQLEEVYAHIWFKKHGKTKKLKYSIPLLKSDPKANMRQYPNFSTYCKATPENTVDKYTPPKVSLVVGFERLYPKNEEELQNEEILAIAWRNNQTNNASVDMEETMCAAHTHGRKSFFPRKSIMLPIQERTPTRTTKDEELENRNDRVGSEDMQLGKADVEMPASENVPNQLDNYQAPTSAEAQCELKSISTNPNAVSPLFEIYEDATQNVPTLNSWPALQNNVKTPSSPCKVNDENEMPLLCAQQNAPIFEETCSTQTFDIFLRVASTPMAAKKSESKLAGSLFKEPLREQQTSSVVTKKIIEAESVSAYSSLNHKQLSTILETSENGTNLAGASAKSTGNSPEVDVPATISCSTHKETLHASTANDAKKRSVSPKDQTPFSARLQLHQPIGVNLQSSITDQSVLIANTNPMANFTRFEEREELPFTFTTQHAHFQEDKTETVSKVWLPNRHHENNMDSIFNLPTTQEDNDIQLLFADLHKPAEFGNFSFKSPPDPVDPPIYLELDKNVSKSNSRGILKNQLTSSSALETPLHSSKLKSVSYAKMPFENESDLFSGVSQTGSACAMPIELKNASVKENIFPDTSDFFCIPSFLSKQEKTSIMDHEAESKLYKSATTEPISSYQPPSGFIESFVENVCISKESRVVNTSSLSEPKTVELPKPTFMIDSALKPRMPIERAENDNYMGSNISNNDVANTLHPLQPHFDAAWSKNSMQADNANEKYFELNAETEMFATNISMIKNSTLLPSHGENFQNSHTRKEADDVEVEAKSISKEQSMRLFENSLSDASVALKKSFHLSEFPEIHFSSNSDAKIDDDHMQTQHNNELSIYDQNTPRTPILKKHVWEDSLEELSASTKYLHDEADITHSEQTIENLCALQNVNPFNKELTAAFLAQIDFAKYIDELPTCEVSPRISRLRPNNVIKCNEMICEISKLIGEGAYGAVYSGYDIKSCKKYALKQERPPNLWEYYICLEVHSRLQIEEMRAAFMSVDYAIIGDNSSVLVSQFSPYGSLITVCNKIKKHTSKTVDEYVVMFLMSELLEIIDHLHAMGIIHADMKADNILVMKKLNYHRRERALQLIDFGVSIDMRLFKEGQTFNYTHKDAAFNCVEMREGRPFTYQIDLYGLAAIAYVLLFGKYMEIEKRPNGLWMQKTHIPRYFNKPVWESFFKTLLNVRDCSAMPNLQLLRTMLKEEIAAKEKYVANKIAEFNLALDS